MVSYVVINEYVINSKALYGSLIITLIISFMGYSGLFLNLLAPVIGGCFAGVLASYQVLDILIPGPVTRYEWQPNLSVYSVTPLINGIYNAIIGTGLAGVVIGIFDYFTLNNSILLETISIGNSGIFSILLLTLIIVFLGIVGGIVGASIKSIGGPFP